MKRDGRVGGGWLVVWRLALCVGTALVSSACSSSAASVPPTSQATGPAVSPGTAGMAVMGAEAMPIASNGNALSVVAAIRNDTGTDDRLVGASAPGAKLGALYATCACIPARVDPTTGLVGKSTMPWWLIPAGESIDLRRGAGEIILTGLPAPVTSGTIQVTFLFEMAAPVVVDVPVVASTD